MFLVTGANGLLGSFICRHLLEKNVAFKALVRPNSDLRLLGDIAHQITFVKGDVSDIFALEDALEGIETVIHSAAIVSFHQDDEQKMFRTNIQGTSNLVNTCIKHNVPNFVYVSSVAALGKNKQVQVTDETTKWENSGQVTAYAKSKYLSELEVWRGQMEGLKVIVVNPSVILGPGDFNKSSAQVFKFVWDEKPYYTEGSLNFIDVRDVTNIIWKLIENKAYGERYILNNGTISYKKILELIAKNFNKKEPNIKVPSFLLRMVVHLESVRALITKQRPLLTKETVNITKRAAIYDNSKIKNALNYKFIPLEETIQWTCQEFIKKNIPKTYI